MKKTFKGNFNERDQGHLTTLSIATAQGQESREGNGATWNQWKVSLGGFRGRFCVNNEKAVKLVSPGVLSGGGASGLRLSARIDPRGSGWLATGATAATTVMIAISSPWNGFAAGPIWLIWYALIVALRRRTFTFDLDQAEKIIVDEKHHRIGIRTFLRKQPCWLAFEIVDKFDAARHELQVLWPDRIELGTVNHIKIKFISSWLPRSAG